MCLFQDWHFGMEVQLGRNDFGGRMALAKLQVLWPLICAQLVYGLLKRRAEALDLDFKEVQRWWGGYSRDGVAGCATSGVSAYWKSNLPPLERALSAELEKWKAAGDTTFTDAMSEVYRTGDLGKLKLPLNARDLPYAAPFVPGDAQGGIRVVAGQSDEVTQAEAMQVARARFDVIEPLLTSIPTDRELEDYAHGHGTSGASVRNWLARFSKTKQLESLMPNRVYRWHVGWAQEREAVKARVALQTQKGAGEGAKPVFSQLVKPIEARISPKAATAKPRDVACEEIGRLRRVAVEQASFRKGDPGDADWTDKNGQAEFDWHLEIRRRPETLRLWCRAYEKAVRQELLRFTSPGSFELATLLKVVLNRNMMMSSQLGWSDEKIDQAVARARAAGARGLQPKNVTADMVREVWKHSKAMAHGDSKTFMGRARKHDDFI